MGIMDSVINNAVRGGMPGGANPLIGAAIQLLTQAGGVGGLTQRFQSKGLGHVAQSWVSNGPNLPVDESQLQQALGREQISTVAQQAGIPMSELSQKLSGFLPKLVNELTPNGQVPQGQPDTQSLLSVGMKLLGR